MLIGLRQAGLGITAATVQKPTLDEVFLALTGHDTGDHDRQGRGHGDRHGHGDAGRAAATADAMAHGDASAAHDAYDSEVIR